MLFLVCLNLIMIFLGLKWNLVVENGVNGSVGWFVVCVVNCLFVILRVILSGIVFEVNIFW